MKRPSPIYIRNFIFGVEDSLVSTVGLLSGMAVAGVSRQTIILTGLILIFVEAFSMGIGSFLSENTVEEARNVESNKSLSAGFIMFVSYFFAGFIPLAPYLLTDRTNIVGYSIGMSLIALLTLGYISGVMFRISPIKNGLRMFVLGGGAIIIGVIVGRVIPH